MDLTSPWYHACHFVKTLTENVLLKLCSQGPSRAHVCFIPSTLEVVLLEIHINPQKGFDSVLAYWADLSVCLAFTAHVMPYSSCRSAFLDAFSEFL